MSNNKNEEKPTDKDDIEVVDIPQLKKKLRKNYIFIQFCAYLFIFLSSIALIIAVLSGGFLWILFYSGLIILCVKYLIKLPKRLKVIISKEVVDVKEFNEENKYFINAMYISSLLIAARIVYMASYDSEGISLGILIWFFIFYLYFGQKTLSLPKKILEKQPKS